MPRRHRLVLTLLAGLGLAACSTAPAPTTSDGSTGGSGAGPVRVTAAFYPLEYLLARIGGDAVTVTTLTKPGVEPHDLELSPADLAGLRTSRLVVTLAGFQPAVDTAVAQQKLTVLDVSAAADLTLDAVGEDHGSGPAPKDPHFWLDPVRYASVASAVADRLATLDAPRAATYRANATTLVSELTALDGSLSQGLARCSITKVVTSHASFGYLLARHGLTQVPLAGLSPEQEPSPKKLAEVAALVKEHGVTTIYAETLVDHKFATTVATSTGARLAVLDPIEGVTPTSPGTDYPSIMKANLQSLRQGQQCS